MMRAARDALVASFDASEFGGKKKHHYKEDRWIKEVRGFLNQKGLEEEA